MFNQIVISGSFQCKPPFIPVMYDFSNHFTCSLNPAPASSCFKFNAQLMAYFFDNLLHTDVRHNIEEKICCYICVKTFIFPMYRP